MNHFKFHHLGVAVADIEKAAAVYEELFGYIKLSEPLDEPSQNVRLCFLGTGASGEVVIELISPLTSDSPVSQILNKGIGAYHTCYEVDDIVQALKAARAKGCIIVQDPSPRVTYDGRRVAWFYTPTRQLVELVEIRIETPE